MKNYLSIFCAVVLLASATLEKIHVERNEMRNCQIAKYWHSEAKDSHTHQGQHSPRVVAPPIAAITGSIAQKGDNGMEISGSIGQRSDQIA